MAHATAAAGGDISVGMMNDRSVSSQAIKARWREPCANGD